MVGKRTKRASKFVCALPLLFLAGCAPLYIWDTHVTATPKTETLAAGDWTREPVAMLGPIAPAGFQGFNPFLSRSLSAAIAATAPSIRAIPNHETVSLINGKGLSPEYGELIAGFVKSGILERERLQRLGSALGSRYALLPGFADFNQILLDRFEFAGLKLVRNRVITLRLWLQLWNTDTGQMVWQSTGEVNVARDFFLPQRVIPLDEICQKLWGQMLEENLLSNNNHPQRPSSY
jgi:hypothetical protein